MAPHSSTLAWRIPWMEEPGGLQSMGSLRVRHDWAASLSLFTFMHWRRKWQPTPVFLPGESQGRRSLVGCRLWDHTESDTLCEVKWLSSSSSSPVYRCDIDGSEKLSFPVVTRLGVAVPSLSPVTKFVFGTDGFLHWSLRYHQTEASSELQENEQSWQWIFESCSG